jgi:hypothetical protein
MIKSLSRRAFEVQNVLVFCVIVLYKYVWYPDRLPRSSCIPLETSDKRWAGEALRHRFKVVPLFWGQDACKLCSWHSVQLFYLAHKFVFITLNTKKIALHNINRHLKKCDIDEYSTLTTVLVYVRPRNMNYKSTKLYHWICMWMSNELEIDTPRDTFNRHTLCRQLSASIKSDWRE